MLMVITVRVIIMIIIIMILTMAIMRINIRILRTVLYIFVVVNNSHAYVTLKVQFVGQ